MSRTLRLLHGAQSAMQRATGRNVPPKPVMASESGGDSRSGQLETSRPSGLVYHNGARGPSSALQLTQKRELLKLISSLFRSSDPGLPRLVGVADVYDGSSSTRISACIGELLAETVNDSICVVDSNLHHGRLHREFDLNSGIGLADAMIGENAIRDYCLRINESLWSLTAGSDCVPNVLANRDALRARFEELRQEFTFCVIALPPVLGSSDALVVGQMMDAVLLVVEAEVTPRQAAVEAKETLAKACVPLAGAILNNRRFPIPQWLDRHL